MRVDVRMELVCCDLSTLYHDDEWHLPSNPHSIINVEFRKQVWNRCGSSSNDNRTLRYVL